MRLSNTTAGVMALVLYLIFGALTAPLGAQAAGRQTSPAQPPPVPDWQTAAGGKMAFELASIRPAPGDLASERNFPWVDGAAYPPNGGYFYARCSLDAYIMFAYKLFLTPDQRRSMLAHQPKWVGSDNFTIRAHASGNPTRDQMRLMVQSLLADRFKLAVHFESQEVQALALTLITPGKTGPGLRPHSEGPPCDSQAAGKANGSKEEETHPFPPVCGVFYVTELPGQVRRLGARNTTMASIATALAGVEWQGRPVVDQTGLSGKFDFKIDWSPNPMENPQPDADDQQDSTGAPFQAALKQQLGLKLVKQKAAVQVLAIDHVERPSEN